MVAFYQTRLTSVHVRKHYNCLQFQSSVAPSGYYRKNNIFFL